MAYVCVADMCAYKALKLKGQSKTIDLMMTHFPHRVE